MREEMSFEEKKANAIKLLEKYKFNEEVLQVYRDLKEDDEWTVVKFEVIDELNYPDGHGEKEILPSGIAPLSPLSPSLTA